jgi:hypothetical protein
MRSGRKKVQSIQGIATKFDASNDLRYSRRMTRYSSSGRRLAAFAMSIFAISCTPSGVEVVTAPSIPMPPVPISTPQMPPAANPPASVKAPEKLAVLPIEDEKLFRSERALLRFELAGHLARLLRDRTIVPIAEVDAKIRPVSSTTGHLCAYEGVSTEKRARYKGWEQTRILHVAGMHPGPGEQLWVEIVDGMTTRTTLQGPWNPKMPRVDAYRAAFAAFVVNDGGALLGGLGASGSYQGALHEGPVTICETKFFGACDASSVDWQDRIGLTAACFAGVDESTHDLLIQGDVGPYCEMENLDYADGRNAKLEACLCKTLGTSSAMVKRPGRRTIRVHYEAPDLQGKPRPELRVVEASTNIDTADDWHSMDVMVNGKKQYQPVRRLSLENLDQLAESLSRCTIAPGTLTIADLDVREDGYVTGAKVLSSGLDKQTQTCIEQHALRGAFDCTNDGKSARVRIAIEWRAP